MKFGKDHKAIISSLEGDEVEAYICFLFEEIRRHEIAIKGAEGNIDAAKDPIDFYSKVYWRATIKFYKSAIRRHKEDIRGAHRRIRQAKMLKM